jgi:hypothetical protein
VWGAISPASQRVHQRGPNFRTHRLRWRCDRDDREPLCGQAVPRRPHVPRVHLNLSPDGAPDFGTITIRYVPAERLLEQKALRDFLTGFRDRDVFQEEAVNAILDAVVASCDPVYCQVEGAFNMRGGMSVRAIAEHGSDPRESRASSASDVCLRGKRHARIKEERTRALSIPQLSLFEPTARRRS